MSALSRALRAETLKLRGTLALHLCVIAPAIVVLLVVLQMLVSGGRGGDRSAAEAWQFFAQGILVLWAFLMLPLFVTLQSALLAGLEHNERQWKHLLALPVPRHVHYVAKLLVLAAIVVAATSVLVLLIVLAGSLLAAFAGDQFRIGGAPPWLFLASRAGATVGAAWFIVALHTWIAIRWSSFTVAVSVGMTATVMGFLIGQSPKYGHLYPWTMPMQVLGGEGEKIPFVLCAGLVGGSIVALLGLWDYLRRDMA